MSLPRVTEILEAVGLGPDFSAVPAAVLEAARDRGSAVHAALEAHAYGYLDPAEIRPDVAPYLSAYEKFLAESKHEPIASEVLVEHPAWQYAGHLDRIGWLVGKRTLLDWKSGWSADRRAAGYQLAGYRLAWNASHPAEPADTAAVLSLREDGTYRLYEIENIAQYEQVFLAALVVYRARKERGR